MQNISKNKQANPQPSLQNCLGKNIQKYITSNITNMSLYLGRETICSEEWKVCWKGETTLPTTGEDSKKPVQPEPSIQVKEKTQKTSGTWTSDTLRETDTEQCLTEGQ